MNGYQWRYSQCCIDGLLLFIAVYVDERKYLSGVWRASVDVEEGWGLWNLKEGGFEVVDGEGQGDAGQLEKRDEVSFQTCHYNISLEYIIRKIAGSLYQSSRRITSWLCQQ